jgi:RNA polymerase sigma-70 factor (ECF subfamily)
LTAPAEQDDLEAWILATAPRAVAYATSLLRDRNRAEDVVQECYCRLLQKANLYDLSHSGLKLLFKAITRACINVSTRERRFFSLNGCANREEDGFDPEDSAALKPERIMMTKELEQAVADGLAQLPVTQRAALELKSLGHSLQEIAALLDITANHAGVLIHRARKAMASYLVPFVGEASG